MIVHSGENMFHFLVTSDSNAWETGLGVEEYSISRFLEYTTDDIVAKFKPLTSLKLAQLKLLPCLCAYEGAEDLKIGKVRDIRHDKGTIRVEVEFNSSIPPIPFHDVFLHKKRLSIHEWEFARTHWALKPGNLFEKLRDVGLLPQAALSAQPPPQAPLPDSFQSSPPEDEPIRNVSDFVARIGKLNDSSKEAFYRGHTDSTYQLKPSVFRTRKDGVPLFRDSEHQMFREVLVSNSFDFKDDTSTLDRLVRMQHYELPTRLLDITANPLIALFFAVFSKQQSNEKLEKPGEVILFQLNRETIKYFDSDTASCIANLALLSSPDKNGIDFTNTDSIKPDNLAALSKFNNQPPLLRLLHYIKNEKPYFQDRILPSSLRSVICVKSKRSNDRISSQSGAFLLFGHDAVLEEETTDEITIHRIKIANKRDILDELERINITESTVFPYLANTCNHIKTRYQTKSEPVA